MKPHPLTQVNLEHLDFYGNTVISPSCFKYYDEDPSKVVNALKKLGYKKVKCWVSSLKEPSYILPEHQFKPSIIIEGKK